MNDLPGLRAEANTATPEMGSALSAKRIAVNRARRISMSSAQFGRRSSCVRLPHRGRRIGPQNAARAQYAYEEIQEMRLDDEKT